MEKFLSIPKKKYYYYKADGLYKLSVLREIISYPCEVGWFLQKVLAIPLVIYRANTQDLILTGSCVGICAINGIRILSGTYLHNKASRYEYLPNRSRILGF
jgi:hypothetical protein